MPDNDPDLLSWRAAVERALEPLHRAVGHDLRSLLNAIRLNTTVLRRTLVNGGGGERWLDVVEQETGRLDQLLDAYLSLTACAPEGSEVDPGAALLAAEPLLATLAEKRQVDWRLDAEPTPGAWPVGVERALVATVCLALDATSARSAARVGCRRDDAGALRATVRAAVPATERLDGLWRPFAVSRGTLEGGEGFEITIGETAR